MTKPASNHFELEIDPEWTRNDIAMRLRAIADLVEQGYSEGELWLLDLEWDLDVVQDESDDE